MPVVIAIIVVIIAYVILKKTALGLYIESVGINGTASRLVGLNSTMIKFLTYLICGVLAGVAGFVASSRIYSADANNIGLNLEMDAILAVALGGNALGDGICDRSLYNPGTYNRSLRIECISRSASGLQGNRCCSHRCPSEPGIQEIYCSAERKKNIKGCSERRS